MKLDLMDLGYNKEDIMHLTPERAHKILKSEIKKE